jgi:hypothetical protein
MDFTFYTKIAFLGGFLLQKHSSKKVVDEYVRLILLIKISDRPILYLFEIICHLNVQSDKFVIVFLANVFDQLLEQAQVCPTQDHRSSGLADA